MFSGKALAVNIRDFAKIRGFFTLERFTQGSLIFDDACSYVFDQATVQ